MTRSQKPSEMLDIPPESLLYKTGACSSMTGTGFTLMYQLNIKLSYGQAQFAVFSPIGQLKIY